MANWKYKLKFSRALRNAIHDEDSFAVLDALVACFTEVNQLVPEYYDEDDLAEDLMDIDSIRDDLEEPDHYGQDDEDIEDNINYQLSKLYDICDAYRIWIEI